MDLKGSFLRIKELQADTQGNFFKNLLPDSNNYFLEQFFDKNNNLVIDIVTRYMNRTLLQVGVCFPFAPFIEKLNDLLNC